MSLPDTIENPLGIWEQVDSTPPAYTKQVSVRGGFTAIDPQFQLKQATRLWGPYGTDWGLRDLKFDIIENEMSPIMMLQCRFYYPVQEGDASDVTEFEIAVDMPLRPNDDCCKKLMTSARSKALSYLGFGADVFLGQFDDNHYVQMQQIKYGDQDKFLKHALQRIAACQTEEELEDRNEKVAEMIRDKIIEDKHMQMELLQAIVNRRAELEG